MRAVRISKSARKDTVKLPPKHRRQILEKIFLLQENVAQPDAKKLTGYSDLWRVDSGEYRIVYSFDNKTVFIDVVGKRNDSTVYRLLKRRRR